MGRGLVAVVVSCVLATSSGCALLMSANAHHNSGGTACVDSPIFGVIDILIAVGIAGAVGASDASAGWYVASGVFGVSGVAGSVSAFRCQSNDEVASDAPPATNTAPSFGDAPVDPEARPATPEELGLHPPPPSSPNLRLDRNGIPLSLPPAPPPTPPPTTRPPPIATDPEPTKPASIKCTIQPAVPCPDGYYCKLVAENTGECESMTSRW